MTAPKTTRMLAAERGQRTYWTGKACPHGHVAERDTVSGWCCECRRKATAIDRARIRALLNAATKGRR